MPMLSLVEAAITIGVGVELIEYFISHCPKHGESRTLAAKKAGDDILIDETDLLDYQKYLSQPWPIPAKAQRPGIPERIKEDIRLESHLACAICGHMDNGEVAHIEAVSGTLNNSPDNLLLLCPNHHSKYDLGYKPSNNVTIETVRAAKLLKRRSRQRMLSYEVNAVKGFKGLLQLIKSIGKKLQEEANKEQVEILTTEVQKLLEMVPELTKAAEEQARQDRPDSKVDKLIATNAPTFAQGDCTINRADFQDLRQMPPIDYGESPTCKHSQGG